MARFHSGSYADPMTIHQLPFGVLLRRWRERRRMTQTDLALAAKAAIDSVLQAHKPYPAFAVDRHWNVVLSNSALPQLYEGCSAELVRPPVNAVRLILHPAGMGPRIVNFAAWRAHTLSVLRQQVETRADPVIQGLLAEVAAYPVPADTEPCEGPRPSQHLGTPLRIATRLSAVSFRN